MWDKSLTAVQVGKEGASCATAHLRLVVNVKYNTTGRIATTEKLDVDEITLSDLTGNTLRYCSVRLNCKVIAQNVVFLVRYASLPVGSMHLVVAPTGSMPDIAAGGLRTMENFQVMLSLMRSGMQLEEVTPWLEAWELNVQRSEFEEAFLPWKQFTKSIHLHTNAVSTCRTVAFPVKDRNWLDLRFIISPYLYPNGSLFELDVIHAIFGNGKSHGVFRQAAVMHRVIGASFPTRVSFNPREIENLMPGEELTPELVKAICAIGYYRERGMLFNSEISREMSTALQILRSVGIRNVSPIAFDLTGLMADQIEVCQTTLSERSFAIVTGPGGTGKTRLITTVAKSAAHEGALVVALGFMGVVVSKMRKELGNYAYCSTIHMLALNEIRKNRLLALANERRVIFIIEEGFMVGHRLFLMFLLSMKPLLARARIFIFGDHSQLPPMNEAPFVHYLAAANLGERAINLPWISFGNLYLNKRQGEGSELAEVCRNIRCGIMPDRGRSLKVVTTQQMALVDALAYQGTLVSFPERFLIMAATHAKVEQLTCAIRAVLNPVATVNVITRRSTEVESLNPATGKTITTRTVKDYHLNIRWNDLVILTHNYILPRSACICPDYTPFPDIEDNKSVPVYNGMVGILERIYGSRTAVFRTSDGRSSYPVSLECFYPRLTGSAADAIPADAFICGYARTVHKSQGAEADEVVYVSCGPPSRATAYTAISRGRKCVTIFDASQNHFRWSLSKPNPHMEAGMNVILDKYK
jgi:hypothetical protein